MGSAYDPEKCPDRHLTLTAGGGATCPYCGEKLTIESVMATAQAMQAQGQADADALRDIHLADQMHRCDIRGCSGRGEVRWWTEESATVPRQLIELCTLHATATPEVIPTQRADMASSEAANPKGIDGNPADQGRRGDV